MYTIETISNDCAFLPELGHQILLIPTMDIPEGKTASLKHRMDSGIDLYSMMEQITYDHSYPSPNNDLYGQGSYGMGSGYHMPTIHSTGYRIFVPKLYHSMVTVCSRGSLAMNGIFVANAPGIVDPGYTGELKVVLANISGAALDPSKAIAQLCVFGDAIVSIFDFVPSLPEMDIIDAFYNSSRGTGGFGSTD